MYNDDIKKVVQEFLEKLTITFDAIEVSNDVIAQQTHFLIQTKDSRLLIGNQGVHLQAFNHLVKQMIRKKFPDLSMQPNFLVDVNQYYSKRINEILYQAKITAERVKMFKRDIELLPMSAYERLLVHNHFANDGTIKTESQGEGKFRKVVLKYCEENKTEALF